MKVLVLNSGSSSQKSCLYEIGDVLPEDAPGRLWQGTIEWEGEAGQVEIKNGRGFSRKEKIKVSSRAQATAHLLDTLWKGEARAVSSLSEIDVVGHRIVHGGPAFEEPVVITPEVKSAIAAVSAIAPLHNRAELEGVEIIEKLLGAVRQVAVFDTGFHKKMPLSAAVVSGTVRMVRGRNSPLWISRHQSQVLRPARGATSAAKSEFIQAGELSSGKRMFAGSHPTMGGAWTRPWGSRR